MDINQVKESYSELEKEFGEKGAAVLAGLQGDGAKEDAFSGAGRNYDMLCTFLERRCTAYSTYSERNTELLNKLEHFITEQGSAGKAADALGISTGTISGIRNCKYKGNPDEIFEKLRSYFELKQEKLETKIYKDIEYAPTSISETIYQLLRSVHLVGECEIITGDAGIGKTRAIKKYASDYPGNTVVITPGYADSSVRGVLMLIADSLGINGVSGLNNLHRAVCSRLHDGMLIIVDEAQHLSFKAIDHLRTIATAFTEKGETLGVAFIGNPSMHRHFTDKKLSESGQVWNRAGFRPEFHSEDVTYDDVKLLFPLLSESGCEAELKFLLAISRTNGEGIRRAVIFYKNAYNSNGGNVTIDYLAALARKANARIPNIGAVLKRIADEK